MGAVSVSQSGLLAYHEAGSAGGMALTWFDRRGKPGVTVGNPAVFGPFQLSPDGRNLAATLIDRGSGTSNIWTYDVSRSLGTRLTFYAAADENPVWSPDGRIIVYRSRRKEHIDLYRKSADGAGNEELLYSDDLDKTPTSWSPDGKFLLYSALAANSKTVRDIWVLPLTPEQTGGPLKPHLVLQTPFEELDGQFSPDGKWMAYRSDDSQRPEIYVTPFPPLPSGPGGKRQISTEGGAFPRWRADGKEIFYLSFDGRLMAAEVTVKGATMEVGEVRSLFGPINTTGGSPYYDVSPDGQRFLMSVARSGEAPSR